MRIPKSTEEIRMKKICVSEDREIGNIKPMHAVNNGPSYKFASDQRITNIDAFRDAGIPYARTHDSSFYSTYGGEHTVDVHAIFPDFNADPYDAASYDFVCTDEYLKVMEMCGVKPFYRLGSKIEHTIKKYGTLPPKDFKKWAIVCEHIIRHYNEGFANGFHMNIEYWEIWNEPDLDPDDSTHKRTWGGTAAQFYEFFNIALEHLKGCFPDLKIGGPAFCDLHNKKWLDGFFASIKVKPDFLSWHIYSDTVERIVNECRWSKELFESYGMGDAEIILNEWNYVKGWTDDQWVYSLKTIKSLKGASFSAGVMCSCQYEPVDMLMYYDARPCSMNGMFCTDWVCENLKGYYPFKMFNTLYSLKTAVPVTIDGENIYAAAAKDGNGRTAIMLTYYDDKETDAFCDVTINLKGDGRSRTADFYLLDENHNAELVKTEKTDGNITLKMSLFSTLLIDIHE